jgi:hypothetical protein
MITKDEILNLLQILNNSRPGFELGNYGSFSDYRADCRVVAKHKRQVSELIRFARMVSVTADHLLFELSAGKRLSLEGGKLNYTTGQYYPMEYRAAIRSVLISAIWTYFRDKQGCETREQIVEAFRRNFSKEILKLI